MLVYFNLKIINLLLIVLLLARILYWRLDMGRFEGGGGGWGWGGQVGGLSDFFTCLLSFF